MEVRGLVLGLDSGGGEVEAGFFFSSRRRHTRLVRDWSSDVCSSDLEAALGIDEANYPLSWMD